MVRRLLAALLATLAIAAPAGGGGSGPSAAERVEAVYDFYIGGLWAGVLAFDADRGGSSYRVRLDARTAGLPGLFFRAGAVAEAEGRAGGTGLSPERFTADAHEFGRRQSVEVAFSAGRPVAVEARPAYRQRPWSIAADAQSGVTDPLSAAFGTLAPASAEAICDRRVEIFDGERRWAVEIGPPQPPASDGRIRCDAAYLRLAGFKPSLSPRRPFALYFADRGDSLFRGVRVAGETSFGLAVLLLRD